MIPPAGRTSVGIFLRFKPGADDHRMNLLSNASPVDLGASVKYGRAVFGLMVAWALDYM